MAHCLRASTLPSEVLRQQGRYPETEQHDARLSVTVSSNLC